MKRFHFFNKIVLVLAIVFAGNSHVKAQLLGWYFNAADGNTATTGQEAAVAARIVDANLEESQLSRGDGFELNATTFGRTIMAKFKYIAPNVNVLRENAFDNGSYFQFTVKPKAGNIATLTQLNYKVRIGNNSSQPFIFRWAYSTDNWATYKELGDADVSYSTAGGEGGVQPAIDLSGETDLKDIPASTTVIFRLYVWGAQGVDANARTFCIGQSTNITTPDVVLSVSGATTTLPVTLLSFQGINTLSGNWLDWETASEKNSDYFEILRSADNKSFVSVGTKQAQGNTNAKVGYSFTDRNPLKGANYYKLKQVDTDGNSTEYGPIVVNANIQSESGIRVSFNEATNELFITVANDNLKDNGVLTISDINGRRLQNQNITLNNNISQIKLTADLDKGKVYLIALKTEKNSSVVKFIR